MALILLLLRRAKLRLAAIVIIGATAGFANGALIAAINEALGGRTVSMAMYAGLCALVLLGNTVPEILLGRVTHQMAAELRLGLARHLLQAPLRTVEQMGRARVLAAFGEDLQLVVSTAAALPTQLICGTIVVGCLAYVGWLAPSGLLVFVPAVVGGVVLQSFLVRRFTGIWRAERASQTRLHHEQLQLLSGLKELELNDARRREYLELGFDDAVARVARRAVRAADARAISNNLGHVYTWLVLGVLLYGTLQITGDDHQVARGYVLTAMYMWGPFRAVIASFADWARARIAMQQIEALGMDLARADAAPARWAPPRAIDPVVVKALFGIDEDTATGRAPSPMRPTRPPAAGRHVIELDQVRFAYAHPSGASRTFHTGPVDLVLRSSEILYIVGPNGSGKTTLAKLLTGLYSPDAGELRFDGEAVTDETREAYRNRFAAVFHDFHVFDALYGLPARTAPDEQRRILRELGLDPELTARRTVDAGSLSTGQRKRLALLIALLEDREFYLFDEWAADQDPEFREVFYRRLLPDLAARGKGIIAISHDDRYFDTADRIVRMADGQIVSNRHTAGGASPRAHGSEHVE